MNTEIKNAIEKECEKYEIAIPSDQKEYEKMVEEILTDAKRIFTEIGSSHRWYDDLWVVVEIQGVLIGFNWYHVTGDTSISDMDLDFDIDGIVSVKKVTKTIEVYEPQ